MIAIEILGWIAMFFIVALFAIWFQTINWKQMFCKHEQTEQRSAGLRPFYDWTEVVCTKCGKVMH